MVKKRNASKGNQPPHGAPGKHRPGTGESVSGYFRKIFEENPRLLEQKSNGTLLDRWLADHPGQTDVPKSVKGNLANLKSVLRSNKRRAVAKSAEKNQSPGQEGHGVVATEPTGNSELENLEHQIDECLIAAKLYDREGLANAIEYLRRARNVIVWKIGHSPPGRREGVFSVPDR